MRVVCIVLGVVAACGLCTDNAQAQVVETSVTAAKPDSSDWLHWRGPNRNGVVDGQSPVINWGDDTNVLWKAEVPGRGHSSPTVIGDRIFITTASMAEITQSVLCYNRITGEQEWATTVHEGGLTRRIHGNNSRASHTVATNGEHLFCMFVNNAEVMLTKLTLDGEQVWQKSYGRFKSKYGFGAGASPFVWNDKLFLTSECNDDSFILALNFDGEELWRIDRPRETSYSTPVIANVGGRDQLLQQGINSVMSYDPTNGEKLWSVDTDWTVSCGTMVWDGDMVFASGGFPNPQTLGINARTGEVVWTNGVKCYEQSMLVHDGHLYGLSDTGICYCWEAATGEQKWRQRMKSKVSASPVLAGGHIYFTTEDGSCFVIKPNAEACEIVAENDLGDSAFATPTFVDDKIYTRVGFRGNNKLQEYLYCIGK